MHRKEYLLKFEPVGCQHFVFQIKEPKKEEIFISQVGKYIKIEDENVKFVINKEFYKVFLDGVHKFKGHISLSPSTGNIVQRVDVSYGENTTQKKLKYVIKAGRPNKVEKEFNYYLRLYKTPNIKTLYPIGYVINKKSNTAVSGFHFTRLEENVIPLSSIDHKSILKEERVGYISMCAEILANLHFRGYTHNDPNLKNFLLKAGKDMLIIDFVNSNFRNEPYIYTLKNKLTDNKMQAVRYDILTFLGQAVFNEMIRETDEIIYFIKSYVKAQRKLSDDPDLEKVKPHEGQLFLVDLLNAISLHKSDMNIANIIKVLKGKENAEEKIYEENSYLNQSLFDFISKDKDKIGNGTTNSINCCGEVEPNGEQAKQ
ncbi:MAG: hypothetical protein QXW80_00880 [Candidatus Micrarchaeia archaeon]